MENCPDELRLGAFHDGELPAEQVAAVAAHVAGCGPCGAYVAELRRTSAWLTAAAAQTPGLSPIGSARVRRRADAVVAADQRLVRFGLRLSGVAAAVVVAGSAWLALKANGPAAGPAAAVLPPWVAARTAAAVDPSAVATATPAAAWYGVDLDGGGS